MIATGWAKYTKYECLPNRENKLVPILAKNPYWNSANKYKLAPKV